jgi:hypothetical protein
MNVPTVERNMKNRFYAKSTSSIPEASKTVIESLWIALLITFFE